MCLSRQWESLTRRVPTIEVSSRPSILARLPSSARVEGGGGNGAARSETMKLKIEMALVPGPGSRDFAQQTNEQHSNQAPTYPLPGRIARPPVVLPS